MIFVQLFIIMFILSLVVSYFSVPLAKKTAIKFDAIDYPNKRRVNTKPIPRMGGIAIYAAILVGMLLVCVVQACCHVNICSYLPDRNINLLQVFISLTIVFLLGCFDDIYHLDAATKLMGQIVAATIAAFSGISITCISLPYLQTAFQLGFLSHLFTVFLLVAFTNIINLIDGLDGLATGYSLVAGVTLFVLAIFDGQMVVALFATCMVGSLVSFLKYNFYPASIFLGDSGSLLIGYSFGLLYLLAWGGIVTINQLVGVLILFAVPIADTACAIIRRLRMHVRIGTPDKGHIHHRIMAKGADHWRAVLHIYFWALMLSVVTILFTVSGSSVNWLIIMTLAISIIYIVQKFHVAQPLVREND